MNNPFIASDPNILGAQPIIAGTRLTVGFVLDNLAAGRTPEQLIAKTPGLTLEAIKAAKQFVLQSARENNINTYRVPIRIRHLIVALDALGRVHEVVKRIYIAFEYVALYQGSTLRQMKVMDNWGQDEHGHEMSRKDYVNLRSQDETTDWTAIKLDDIENYPYLSYADAETFCYYIPALMINWLVNPASNVDVLFHLYPSRNDEDSWNYRMEQFSLLNNQQKSAVAHFLQHLLDFNDEEMNYKQIDKEARKALDEYWMQFLGTHQEQSERKTKAGRKTKARRLFSSRFCF